MAEEPEPIKHSSSRPSACVVPTMLINQSCAGAGMKRFQSGFGGGQRWSLKWQLVGLLNSGKLIACMKNQEAASCLGLSPG